MKKCGICSKNDIGGEKKKLFILLDFKIIRKFKKGEKMCRIWVCILVSFLVQCC
ncbi:protein of unknown function [[Clostridium] ultunense Esp]|uniref:Uncharacterized protein n=1 Tax=[Clostridium] ultunense Esp TaxID=1288971 RepID=A0A1M4PSY7_9FIRM|nr:protein of unknown function [[Clostridium] ultunense Esp]